MKQIMIDSSTLILILKKSTQILIRFLSMHERKLWKKKVIDVHTINKNKETEIFTEILCGRKLWKKKIIDMHTVNRKKKKKNKDSLQ